MSTSTAELEASSSSEADGRPSRRQLTAGALFAGIGGFTYGFEEAGFKTVWANELDPYACRVYRSNFPGQNLIEKDVRELSVANDKLQPVDVLHAGFPCQSFSQAGDRKGFADARGRLFYEIIRLVNEFGADKPAALVLENAPYLKHGERGVWFLEVQSQLQRLGYWFRDSNAQELDLYDVSDIPQRRNRLFMVAWSTSHFRSGRFSFPSPTAEGPKDAGRFIDFTGTQPPEYYLPEENRYFQMISKLNIDTANERHIYQLRKYFVRQKQPGVCPTLTANMGVGGHNVPFIWDSKGLRKLTERECLRLQGFPEEFDFPHDISSRQRYMQIGNAVAPPVAAILAKTVRQKLEREILI